MTTLVHRITIHAPRHAVWQVLADLERLDRYDPGVRTSRLLDSPGVATGSEAGATRRCDLRPRGWFVERVVQWQPDQALAFELVTCSLPVRSLRHDYTLTEEPGLGEPGGDRPATVVTQTMTYRLKYGPAGRLLDTLVVRRQWDRGIKAFLHGLEQQVLADHAAPAAD